MKRPTILAALVTALAASFAATAVPAQAAVSSASINGLTATLNLDGADDNVTVSVSAACWCTVRPRAGSTAVRLGQRDRGDQTVPADGTFTVIVNGGDGNDSLTVLAQDKRGRRRRAKRRRLVTTS